MVAQFLRLLGGSRLLFFCFGLFSLRTLQKRPLERRIRVPFVLLPAYPTSPSADEVAQKVLSSLPSYPTGVSADEVAQKVLSNLPANPTADQIAQEINSQLSTKPASVPAEYSTATVVIIVAVVAALAIGIVNLYLVRKRK